MTYGIVNQESIDHIGECEAIIDQYTQVGNQIIEHAGLPASEFLVANNLFFEIIEYDIGEAISTHSYPVIRTKGDRSNYYIVLTDGSYYRLKKEKEGFSLESMGTRKSDGENGASPLISKSMGDLLLVNPLEPSDDHLGEGVNYYQRDVHTGTSQSIFFGLTEIEPFQAYSRKAVRACRESTRLLQMTLDEINGENHGATPQEDSERQSSEYPTDSRDSSRALVQEPETAIEERRLEDIPF